MPPTMPRTAPAAITLSSAALAGAAVIRAASSSPVRSANIEISRVSGVADVARQHTGADADLLHRSGVFRVDVFAEDQLGIGAAMQPAVLLYLVLELARRPARIAERQDCARRAVAARDRLEDVQRRGEADAFVDRQRRVLDEEVGAVQHEAALGLHRPALQHSDA